MRWALLGGTFDPPHLAHLVAGEAAFRSLGVDVVAFIPAGSPWQKAGLNVSPAGHRWTMTQLAVAGIDYFAADDREVHRDGWTYTVDTLATFSDTDELWFILGADAAAGLRTWDRHDEILERARIAVAPRPGIARNEVEAAIPDVVWLDMPELPVSGTAIRRHAADGGSVRFLVPDPVWEYIESHALYRPHPSRDPSSGPGL